jgi:hypothetical protein
MPSRSVSFSCMTSRPSSSSRTWPGLWKVMWRLVVAQLWRLVVAQLSRMPNNCPAKMPLGASARRMPAHALSGRLAVDRYYRPATCQQGERVDAGPAAEVDRGPARPGSEQLARPTQ